MYSDIEALQIVILRLCKEKNITINKLASLSNLTQSTIDSIMRGKSKNPKFQTLGKIANGFGVDYDKFITMIRSVQDELNPRPIDFSDFVSEEDKIVSIRVRKLRNDRNITLLDINEKLGLPFSFEEHSYSCKDLVKLCNYFQVSADYLLGLSDDPTRH